MKRSAPATFLGVTVLSLALATTAWAESPRESLVGVEGTVQMTLPAGVRAAGEPDSPIHLRIGDVQITPNAGDYDVHYEVRDAGVYDLRAFLQSADGTAIAGLAPLLVKGVSHLAADDQGKLDLPDPTPFPSYGGYTVARRVAIGAWVLVFLTLILWRRKKKAAVEPVAVETPPLPDPRERLDRLLAAARSGTLTVPETVELELQILAHWREHLDLAHEPVDRAMQRLRADLRGGALLEAIDDWLHVPPARSTPIDVDTLRWAGRESAIASASGGSGVTP